MDGRHATFAALLVVLAGCGSGGGGGGERGIGLKDLNGDGDIRIVCFGDSITQGFGDNPGEPPGDPPGGLGGYPSRLQALAGVTVINAGVGGEETSEALERLPSVLRENHPDYVILLAGANDLERRRDDLALRNLQSMVDRVFGSGAQPVLGTLLPTCCNHVRSIPPMNVIDFNAALGKMAKVDSVPVIDFHAAFRPDPTNGEVDPATGLIHVPDGLHPTPAGYDVMALTAYHAFLPGARPVTPPSS